MGNLNEKNVLHLGAYPIWIFSDRVAHAHHFHQNSVVVVAYLELMNIQNSYNLRIPMNCSNLKNKIQINKRFANPRSSISILLLDNIYTNWNIKNIDTALKFWRKKVEGLDLSIFSKFFWITCFFTDKRQKGIKLHKIAETDFEEMMFKKLRI